VSTGTRSASPDTDGSGGARDTTACTGASHHAPATASVAAPVTAVSSTAARAAGTADRGAAGRRRGPRRPAASPWCDAAAAATTRDGSAGEGEHDEDGTTLEAQPRNGTSTK